MSRRTDRLRAAVEAALVCAEHPLGHIEACEACSWFATASSAAIAAVLPIVEEAQAEIARLRGEVEQAHATHGYVLRVMERQRAVLVWLRVREPHDHKREVLRAALACLWGSVREMGVPLPEEGE